MITIKFLGRTPTPAVAKIGMETDSRAETLVFQLPVVAKDQSAQLIMLLPDGQPETILMDGNMALLPASVLAVPGRIRAYVEILGDDHVVWNSDLILLDVGDLPNVEEAIEDRYPTALQNAMDASIKALRYKSNAQKSAELVLAGSELWSMYVQDTTLVIEHALPDDAYAIAVKNGYTGTAEEWAELVESVSDYVAAEEAKEAADAAQDDVDNLEDTVSALQDTVEGVSDVANGASDAAATAQSAADAAQDAADEAATAAANAQSAADDATDAAAAAQSTADAAAKAEGATVTISPNDWGNAYPYTATKTCEAVSEDDLIVVGVGGTMTGELYTAIQKASIVCTGQGEGTVTFTAFGSKPDVSIPVQIMIITGGQQE